MKKVILLFAFIAIAIVACQDNSDELAPVVADNASVTEVAAESTQADGSNEAADAIGTIQTADENAKTSEEKVQTDAEGVE